MRRRFSLGDPNYFELFIGKRVLKKDVFGRLSGIPVYSANVRQAFGYVEKSNVGSFDSDYVLWGIDGDFHFNLIPKGVSFATTDHCGAIRICNPAILPEYLLHQLELQGHALGFDRGLRASLANMKQVNVSIPVTPEGDIDTSAQKELAARYVMVESIREKLRQEAAEIDRVVVEVPQPGEVLAVRLEDLFDLELTTNRSNFTKRFVNEHPGPIPVYSASGEEEEAGYGYVADNLPGIKYFEDILTWNIDGSKFRAFYRKGRFSLSEKVIPLVLRPQWTSVVSYDYVKHVIDRKAVEAGAAYQNKPGKGRIAKLEIDIPAKAAGDTLIPDLEEQHRLSLLYEQVQGYQRDLVASIRQTAYASVEL